MAKTLAKEIEELTLELVRIPSINSTTGEREIADFISAKLRELAYFKKHPNYVWEVNLKNDRYERKNVFAFVRGENGTHPETVILHGHIDTVGVEDYGRLIDYAFDPTALEQKLSDIELEPEAKQDLESGEWMFGRGTSDMKSGVAVHMAILQQMSKRVSEMKGNILFMVNPAEENQHTGIIESLSELNRLKEREVLEYRTAINTDYFPPVYRGDVTKYIYLGAVGKILPCFCIFGKETHAGECFRGLNPNLIGAEILRLIDLNMDLCDFYEGEYTAPPTVLKFTDLKAVYNVQTPMATFLYFNYFTHTVSVNKVLETLKKIAETAFSNTIGFLEERHRQYCKKVGLKYEQILWQPRVITYEELFFEVREKFGPGLDDKIHKMAEVLFSEGVDARVICLRIVEELKKIREDSAPVVVIFFAPPFCPHNTLKKDQPNEQKIVRIIEEVVGEAASFSGETFSIRKFFPYLSDSSYIKIDDDDDSLHALNSNFPGWDVVYPVPVTEIRAANIPAVNLGVFGKDAHKWTERLNKPYAFNVLPQLIERFIGKILVE
jgi:arginine utilization protein RocB